MFELANLIKMVQVLALALIAGGTLVLGALVAPALFKNLSRIEAGNMMNNIFEKFTQWLETSSLILFVTKFIEFMSVRHFSLSKESIFLNVSEVQQTTLFENFDTPYFFELVFISGIFAISVYLSFELMPKMANAYDNDEKEFQKLHRRSEDLYKFNFLLAVLALI